MFDERAQCHVAAFQALYNLAQRHNVDLGSLHYLGTDATNRQIREMRVPGAIPPKEMADATPPAPLDF